MSEHFNVDGVFVRFYLHTARVKWTQVFNNVNNIRLISRVM